MSGWAARVRCATPRPGDTPASDLALLMAARHATATSKQPAIGRRGDRGELGERRPRGAMDARLPALVREHPGPDLVGHVRQDRREEPQQHAEPEAEPGDRGAAGVVAGAVLHELEVGVGEVVPEERLGLLQRVRVVEGLEGLRHPRDELAEPLDEGAIELDVDRGAAGPACARTNLPAL